MKTQNVTTALAFLVAAFMWGCQESGPVAPEGLGPQFGGAAHPGRHGGGGDGNGDEIAASYMVTHSGDITTDPVSFVGSPGSGKPGTSVDWSDCCGRSGPKIVLSDAFVNQVVPDGKKCFPKEDGTGPRVFGNLSAALRLRKGGVTGQYFFLARGINGSTIVPYQISVTGTVTDEPFAPGPNKTTTVTWEGSYSLGSQDAEVSACAASGASGQIIVPIITAGSGVTIVGVE